MASAPAKLARATASNTNGRLRQDLPGYKYGIIMSLMA